MRAAALCWRLAEWLKRNKHSPHLPGAPVSGASGLGCRAERGQRLLKEETMQPSVWFEVELVLLVVCSLVLPAAVYLFLYGRVSVSRWTCWPLPCC